MPDINMQHFGELQRNQYSIDVEMDASQVASPQQDFPMMLETPNSSNSVLNITAINDLGEQIPTEIEGIANDKNWVHLKDIVQSVTNRKMKIFYGGSIEKPAANSTYGSQAVWDSSYVGVWHMNNDPSGTAPSLLDSTLNGNHGTMYGSMTLADLVDSVYGKAINFDGNDYFSMGALSVASDKNYNYLMQIKTAGAGADAYIMSEGNTADADTIIGLNSFEDKIKCFYRDDSGVAGEILGTALINDNVPHTISNDGDGSNMTGYSNGISEGTDALPAGTTTPNTFAIGALIRASVSNYYTGDVLQARASSTTRSTNYILTTHNNLNNPTAIGADPFYKSISKELNFAESLQSLGRVG